MEDMEPITAWGACLKRTADEVTKFSLAWLEDKANHTPAKALDCITKLRKDHEEVFRTHPELGCLSEGYRRRLEDPKASAQLAWSLPPLLHREVIKAAVDCEAARDIYLRLKLTTDTSVRDDVLESVFLQAPYADSSAPLSWHIWVPSNEQEKKQQDDIQRDTPAAYGDVDFIWLWAKYYSRKYGLPPLLLMFKDWTTTWMTAEVDQWRDRKEKKEVGKLGLSPLSPTPPTSLPSDTWKVAYFARVGQILLESEIAARKSDSKHVPSTLTHFFWNGPNPAYRNEFGIKWPDIGALGNGSNLLTPVGSFFVWGSWRFICTKLGAPTGTGRSFWLDFTYGAVDTPPAHMPSGDRNGEDEVRAWWQQYRGQIMARINAP